MATWPGGIAAITLFAEDLDETKRFYHEVFVLRRSSRTLSPRSSGSRRGVHLLHGPLDRPWGVRTASFRDPAGHIWEVAS